MNRLPFLWLDHASRGDDAFDMSFAGTNVRCCGFQSLSRKRELVCVDLLKQDFTGIFN